MPLINATRGSIIDVAGVLDTPLKLVTIKSLKMNNCNIMSTTTKTGKTIFRGQFSGGQFFWGAIFRGAFSQGRFSGHEITQYENFSRIVEYRSCSEYRLLF